MGGSPSKEAASDSLTHVYGLAGGEPAVGCFVDLVEKDRANVLLVTTRFVDVLHPESGEKSG